MFGYIYKITNTINSKVYIGQTTKTIEGRFETHRHRAKYNSQADTNLSRAIRKYGEDKFKVEELDKANNLEELNKKEVYWISKFNSIEKGYNLEIGGNSTGPRSEETKRRISETLKKRGYPEHLRAYLGNRVGIKTTKESIEKIKKNMPHRTPVACFKNEILVKKFDSLTDASTWLGKPHGKSNIMQCCKGRAKSAYGYKWEYLEKVK